ncbi:methyltransferase domain-containing protein [Embleya sp. NBC_00888]|uniref:methyltransferase domain-containing protein n=1 Tax=Embleya sp. NBC_00888 TaxID=2975960 RepID=UPI0038691F8C|nr:methyltransferase domain-containing protein [Embleya sp. NBC_00888]
MTDDLDRQRRRALEAMDTHRAWPRHAPWVRDAVEAHPRHVFAPERLWDWDGHAYVPVDRGTDPQAWVRLVYAGPYDAAITEITAGRPSSSLSCTSVVAGMLDVLDVELGHRVLELGAGTGWSAALLAHRVGPTGRVTTVETAPDLAASARDTLTRAGLAETVTVVLDDGALGRPETAPYDRVIATYAVDHVPWTWIEQLRPGGDLVFPWGRLGHFAVTVAKDGRSATGWLQGLAQFMPARDVAVVPEFDEVRAQRAAEDERLLARDVAPLHTDRDLLWALRVALPDVVYATDTDEDGVNVWVHDGAGSWAVATTLPDGRVRAGQGGARRLIDEIEAAWDAWERAGRIRRWDHGITITAEEQYLWAGEAAGGHRWPIPTPAPTAH